MAIKENKKESTPKIIYSDKDLAILDEKIQKNYGGFSKIEMFNQFFVDNYAMKIHGNELFVSDIATYEELQNKLSQWHDWRDRKEFGEKKKVEGLEELANGMRIN